MTFGAAAYGEFAWGQAAPSGSPPSPPVPPSSSGSVGWFGASWFRANHFGNNWFGGVGSEVVAPVSGGWFWRAPRHKRLEKYEQELRERDESRQSQDDASALSSKPVARVDPARAAADVAAALAAAREFVSRAYVEPGVDLSAVAAGYATVVLPSPLPEDVSDEDAIALILLLAD